MLRQELKSKALELKAEIATKEGRAAVVELKACAGAGWMMASRTDWVMVIGQARGQRRWDGRREDAPSSLDPTPRRSS